ncbi:MAG TPA: hypothetical protein VLU43_19115 [Anaeromyxobacteraceae bacterium]|nr:hypothetical protein [Anaeromyxobacteraceae bacterium]
MTTPARLGAFAALALAALPGCLLFRGRAPVPGTEEGEWARLRDAATRRFELYDGLVHRANATATFLSPEVRTARARRLAEWLSWTQDELARRLAIEQADAAAGEEFVLVLYVAEKSFNDLDSSRSVWRVAIDLGPVEMLPSKIEAVKEDATLRGLYPWLGPFDVVYRVRAPHPPDGPLTGRPFVLRLASAQGQLPLDFGAPPVKFEVPVQAP